MILETVPCVTTPTWASAKVATMGSSELMSWRLRVRTTRFLMGSAEKICRNASQRLPRSELERGTHPRFDARSSLELLLGVLELDVGVVNRPDDSIDVSRDGNEESRVGEALDRSLISGISLHRKTHSKREPTLMISPTWTSLTRRNAWSSTVGWSES